MNQNATKRKELTTQQRQALAAMLQAGSLTEAAKIAGVNRVTLYRWMADPTFAAALREAESEALAALSRRLVTMGDAAAAALTDALAPGQPIKERLRAAEIVLANLLRIKELLDFEQRLTALEQGRR